MLDDADYYAKKLEALEKTITAYEDAHHALAINQVASYTLDTGQSKQTVTRLNLTEIRKTIDSLTNRREIYRARAFGSGSFTAGPNW